MLEVVYFSVLIDFYFIISKENLTYEYIIILFVTEISPLNSKQFNCTYNN